MPQQKQEAFASAARLLLCRKTFMMYKTPGIRLYPTDFEKAVANNQMLIRARKVSPEREKFEKLFAEKGLIYAARRSKSLKTRMELSPSV